MTLDGLISSKPFDKDKCADDVYCLNQMATEHGWYAASRWFAAGNDVFFTTSRKNREITDRWLDEWALMYNRILYDIPVSYHYNAAVALDCDIFITAAWDEIPKHGTPEVRTYLFSQEPSGMKTPKNIDKISNLNDIDEVIAAWPLPPRKSSAIIVGQSRTLRT